MNAPLPKRIWQWFARTRIGRSIFRVGLPESNLERSQAMVSSFLLHVQPAKVNRHSLRASYSLGLGLISLYLLPDPDRHGRAADVLLRAQHREGVRHDEGPAVRRLGRPGHPQHAPLGGAPDGVVRVAAHVPRVLHRRLQTPARVQLGDRRRTVSADAGAELHRLSAPAAVGPTRVLGDHRRHEHRRLRAGYRSQAEISDARRERGRAGGADPILRAARDRAADGGAFDGGRPPLARAQGRRVVASRRTGRHRPADRTRANCRRTRPTA